MWVINEILTHQEGKVRPLRGWHCILVDEGWEEWVEGSHYGSSALADWRDDPETLAGSRRFYEAGTYYVSAPERVRIKRNADKVS